MDLLPATAAREVIQTVFKSLRVKRWPLARVIVSVQAKWTGHAHTAL